VWRLYLKKKDFYLHTQVQTCEVYARTVVYRYEFKKHVYVMMTDNWDLLNNILHVYVYVR
jgi:hypothetical protein